MTVAGAASTVDADRSGPVATALADLRAWLATATGAAVGEPGGVQVRPVALLPDSGGRSGAARGPLRLRVRFAVLVDLPPADAVHAVDRLLAALAEDGRYLLVLDGAATTADRWPALLLDVAVRVDVPPPPVPRVSGELTLRGGALRAVRGRLLGPRGVPLVGMTVTAGDTGSHVDTDVQGWFTLPGQPAERTVALHLTGRGLCLRADVPPGTTEPVVVHCQIEET